VRRLLLGIAFVGLAYGTLLASSSVWASRARPSHACPGSDVIVLVDTGAGVLSLCRNGATDGVFRVALGRGGVDKRAEGDGRTPKGVYSLGQPRSSGTYHRFIPVGYPTPEQRSQGYSGSAIGIHGPHRAFRWLGPATVAVDWTLGCVAVGTEDEVDAIGDWIARNSADRVVFR
jgi:L,D-peptidoglycan transpeptidase YkuD (ErfK/YbiS/YcfS/YnhG family)